MAFTNARWVWVEQDAKPDTYGEFYDEFFWEKDEVDCLISCDGDYTLFINGRWVSCNQYGDYEWYKSYDVVNITPYLKKGDNKMAVLVWHFGIQTQRSIKAQAGLIFEVKSKDKVLLSSGERTHARYSKAYKQGLQRKITKQLGLSFSYDSTKEDAWMMDGKGFSKAVLVGKNCTLIPRPIERLKLLQPVPGVLIFAKSNRYVLDLGREVVGLPSLKFTSSTVQNIKVAWGEHLQNGHVCRLISDRDFSFDYVAKQGENDFTHYMLRLGCRYLEIFTETPIKIEQIGLLPQVYAVQEKQVKLDEIIDQKIYDACVNTLKLCMMEHYVDTPWREQCLYVYDSRNQALCGYMAFENRNAQYARANIKLISQDKREDGLLSICYPCGMDLTIPSFSLYYFLQVKEYLCFTGDISLAEEIYEKLISVLNVFIANHKDGLTLKFEGENHWNFYDWSPYLDGQSEESRTNNPDLIINLLFILALESLQEIDCKMGKPFTYGALLEESKLATRRAFYKEDDGLFSVTLDGTEFTVLGNALAILTGLTSQAESEYICQRITEGTLLDCSLSMKIFKYNALFKTDKRAYQGWVYGEIRREYGKMLATGNTVWETIDGSSAFGNAGSLCHGWSAVPIYFYLYEKFRNII